MQNYIFEKKNSLSPIFCDDIIDLFNENSLSDQFKIPKNNNDWIKIENTIYKQLLININDYKELLLNELNGGITNDLLGLINHKLNLKDFIIQKYEKKEEEYITDYKRVNNRYNVFTFIFYLNNIDEGGELIFKNKNIVIKPQQGKFVMFPEHYNTNYHCKLPNRELQYIISGQLYNDAASFINVNN